MVNGRGGRERGLREETTHNHQYNDAMSELVPRLPRQRGKKQAIDWLALFREVEAGAKCVAVAAQYRVGGKPLKASTLQKRVKRWREAVAAGDEEGRRRAEGKETGRGVSQMSFSRAEEEVLAGRIQTEKGEGALVDRQYVREMAVEYHKELHPILALRSVTPFTCSSQWITRFRRRNGLSTTEHKIRPVPSTTALSRKELEERAETDQLALLDAIKHYGKHYVVNGDELFARQVEHPSRSWGIVGEPNIVSSNQDKRHGITTTPFVSAAGDILPVQAIAKGRTRRCVHNRHLPPDMAGDFSDSGWQTEETFIRYIEQYLVPYLGPEGGALVIDEYSAHATDNVMACLNEHHIDLIVVPPGMTHVLQPLDVGVNAHVRRSAAKQYIADQHTGKENSDPNGEAATRISNALHVTDSGRDCAVVGIPTRAPAVIGARPQSHFPTRGQPYTGPIYGSPTTALAVIGIPTTALSVTCIQSLCISSPAPRACHGESARYIASPLSSSQKRLHCASAA